MLLLDAVTSREQLMAVYHAKIVAHLMALPALVPAVVLASPRHVQSAAWDADCDHLACRYKTPNMQV